MSKDDLIKAIARLVPDRRVSYSFFNAFSKAQLERYLRKFRTAGTQD